MARNLQGMIARETGINDNDVEKYLDQYIDGLDSINRFDFIEFTDLLPIDSTKKDVIQNRYLFDSSIYTKYPHVDEVLRELTEKGYRIGIYSEGIPHFQENKLKNLMITDFVDQNLVFIVQNKRSKEFIQSLPASIIVDDNADICNILVEYAKHRTIYLKRENKKYTSEDASDVNPKITTIVSLRGLLDVL